ncbi:hypothetical protein Tco_0732035, partial [Tanacetum coccineum]
KDESKHQVLITADDEKKETER